MFEALIGYITFPSIENAREFAKKLLSYKYAACVNIIPAIESIYIWDGEFKNDHEVSMLIKTERSKIDLIELLIKEIHPYQTPAFFVFKPDYVLPIFSNWIKDSLENA